ncbi:hypothetical protein GSY74_02005 [Sulfurovum sp. bin170]|uniref:hypothetical protein n=1 Tax=Sulfurovum sp. bin170 TaxID=2695268 RepID=UPI0013DFD67C|nr:hypothetical protein [Sulfurovum sp. bin170]NEW60045.1 hypothetical protein [Sulfurovum sp. bin170]
MKKLILLLTIVGTMWFTACGSDSSKEAKELLQRILNLVGIPQSIVVNVCQDNNDNNLCESTEILASITIDKGDTVDTIWAKVFDDGSNSYWLENIDPDKKLLLVMQDRDSVQHDDGKFALPFTVDAAKEQNATKELSILESMVDENYLNASEVVAVKSMDSVDKFYAVLLKDLMKNFNTLKDKELDSSQSILANLEYMANDLRDKGISKTLPDRVNACNGNVACVDAIIDDVFKDLEITDSEADEIVQKEREKDAPSEATNSSTGSSRTMFLSKETSYDEDGNVEDTETYQYDSNNRMIDDDECTYNYDSKNRLTESSCTYSDEGERTTHRAVYSYSGDRLIEHTYYTDGKLDGNWKVIEWSGAKPIKIEWTDNENGTWTWTISYTGDNPTHIEYTYSNGMTWKIDREFDNKNTPYDWDSLFGGVYYGWWYGKNNITREEITSSYEYAGQTYTGKTVTRNEITYNSSDLPTRIDTYMTSTSSNSESSYTIHTYTTYEYK